MIEKMGFEKDRRIKRKYRNDPITATMRDGRTFHFRSKLEYRWAQYLDLLLLSGEIQAWDYEFKRFVFPLGPDERGARDFLPDFRVVEKDGTVVWQETKGHCDGKMNTRFKRMAEYYPDEVCELVCSRFSKQNDNRRRVAAKYVRRVIDGSAILKQARII